MGSPSVTRDLKIVDCRFCKYYQPEGRRGGHCDLLCVPMPGQLKACRFAIPPFQQTLSEPIAPLPKKLPLTPEVLREEIPASYVEVAYLNDLPKLSPSS
jgi:hypothetical protein